MKRTQRSSGKGQRRNAWSPNKSRKTVDGTSRPLSKLSPPPTAASKLLPPENIKEKHRNAKISSKQTGSTDPILCASPTKVRPIPNGGGGGRRRSAWGSRLRTGGSNATYSIIRPIKVRTAHIRPAANINSNVPGEQTFSSLPKPDFYALTIKREQAAAQWEEEEMMEEEQEEEEEEELQDGQLSSKQSFILVRAMAGDNIFFTGSAGTGKSFLLREIIDRFNNSPSRGAGVYVTASTGVAAVNIGGCTLHSFAGIALGKQNVYALRQKIKKNPKCRAAKSRWLNAQVLIIDEVSMLDAGLFDKLEHLARLLRENDEPFGGIQVILCGDFFQLPPVKKRQDKEAKQFMFQAKCWDRVVEKTFVLEKIFRQGQDKPFARVLNEIRLGYVSPKAEKMLEACTIPFEHRRRKKDGVNDNDCHDSQIKPTMLYALRKDVEHENNVQLAALEGEEHTFFAQDRGDEYLLSQLKNHCTAPAILHLKVGAQVVLLKNLDFAMGLVNGSRGVVVKFAWNIKPPLNTEKDVKNRLAKPEKPKRAIAPVVRFTNGVLKTLSQEVWEMKMGKKRKAYRTQFPLGLAWALTIHKSQGMTIPKVQMKLSTVWETGQAYVALSRATCQEGLYLIDYDVHKIRASPTVLGYYKNVLLRQASIYK